MTVTVDLWDLKRIIEIACHYFLNDLFRSCFDDAIIYSWSRLLFGEFCLSCSSRFIWTKGDAKLKSKLYFTQNYLGKLYSRSRLWFYKKKINEGVICLIWCLKEFWLDVRCLVTSSPRESNPITKKTSGPSIGNLSRQQLLVVRKIS